MSTKRPSARRKPKQVAVSVPVQWGIPDSLPTVYANQLIITHAGSEFYLIFGELVPPTILGEGNLPEKVDIKPVAKVAVSPEAMLRFAEVIASNVKRFTERA